MSLFNKIKDDNRKQCPAQLSFASGNTIDIIASGIEHKLVGTTCLNNVDTDLISGPVILPPTTDNSHNIGGLIIKSNDNNRGTIVNLIDKNMR